MNFRKLIFPKKRLFEKMLQRYAIYVPDQNSLRIAPTRRLFDTRKLQYLSRGLQCRVYRLNDMDWVVKEGRWDLDINLFGNAKLPLPAKLTEKMLSIFSYTFLPTTKEILRQFKEYLIFVEYFGYFKDKSDYYHPQLDLIIEGQRTVRDSLLFYKEELEQKYNFKINAKIDAILRSEISRHNFLPKEYLLIGKSISQANQNQQTFFIVQKFIKGENLHNLNEMDLPLAQKQQLVLLIYLILLMDYKTHLLPDTRPRYPFAEAYNYLTKTDNIIIGNHEVKFIDTRWFWDRNANFIKRGMIIPDMIINLAKVHLNSLLETC